MSIADTLADKFTAYSVDLTRYSAEVEGEIKGYLKELEQSLAQQIAEVDPVSPLQGSFRQKRLKVLLDEAQGTIGETYTGVKKNLDNRLYSLAKVEGEASRELVNSAVGFDLLTTGASPERLRAIASNVLIDGAPSREWWNRQSRKTLERFKDQVRMGLGQGETVDQIVRRIRGRATGRRVGYKLLSGKQKYAPEFVGGIMDITTRDAESLVRTSVQSVAQSSRFEVYKNNDDLVRGVQALVTLDGRTSELCRARSGRVWTMDGKPRGEHNEPFPGHPPWHWQCRSTLIPVLPSFAEFRKGVSKSRLEEILSEMPRGTQSSMDGQVAADLTYEGWLKLKSPEFQQQVLGPSKWRLWKNNKLSFSQMIDQSGNPLTIAKLQSKYGKGGSAVAKVFSADELRNTWRGFIKGESVSDDILDQLSDVFSSPKELEKLLGVNSLTSSVSKSARHKVMFSMNAGKFNLRFNIDTVERKLEWLSTEWSENRVREGFIQKSYTVFDKLVGRLSEQGYKSVSFLTEEGNPSLSFIRFLQMNGGGFSSRDSQKKFLREMKEFISGWEKSTKDYSIKLPSLSKKGKASILKLLDERDNLLFSDLLKIEGLTSGDKLILRTGFYVNLSRGSMNTISLTNRSALSMFRRRLNSIVKMEGISWDLTFVNGGIQNFGDVTIARMLMLRERVESKYKSFTDFWKSMTGTEDINPSHVMIDWRGEVVQFSYKSQRIEDLVRDFQVFKNEVQHVLFVVKEEFRGKGLSKTILRGEVGVYEALGLEKVNLLASLKNGAYTWLKFGFVPDYSWINPSVSMMKNNFAKIQGLSDSVKRNISGLLSKVKEGKDFWKIADLKVFSKVGSEINIGKKLLVGTQWEGSLDLTDKAVMERFYSYVNPKPGVKKNSVLKLELLPSKKYPDQYLDNFTDDMKDALKKYKNPDPEKVGFGFEEIQYMKRMESGELAYKLKIDGARKLEIQSTIEAMDEAFERSIMRKDAILYHHTVAKPGRPWTNVKVGDIITDSGYVSTSRIDDDHIRDFFTFGKNKNTPAVTVRIHAKQGTHAIEMDQFETMGEFETLLPSGMRFKVTKVTEGTFKIGMIETPLITVDVDIVEGAARKLIDVTDEFFVSRGLQYSTVNDFKKKVLGRLDDGVTLKVDENQLKFFGKNGVERDYWFDLEDLAFKVKKVELNNVDELYNAKSGVMDWRALGNIVEEFDINFVDVEKLSDAPGVDTYMKLKYGFYPSTSKKMDELAEYVKNRIADLYDEGNDVRSMVELLLSDTSPHRFRNILESTKSIDLEKYTLAEYLFGRSTVPVFEGRLSLTHAGVLRRFTDRTLKYKSLKTPLLWEDLLTDVYSTRTIRKVEDISGTPERFIKQILGDEDFELMKTLNMKFEGSKLRISYEGSRILKFEEIYDLDKLIATKLRFRVADELKDSFIESQLLTNSMDTYRALGIKEVRAVTGEGLSNAYELMKLGFLPSSHSQFVKVRTAVRNYRLSNLDDILEKRPWLYNVLEEFEEGGREVWKNKIWEIVDLVDQSDLTNFLDIGKAILGDIDLDLVLKLNDSRQMRRFAFEVWEGIGSVAREWAAVKSLAKLDVDRMFSITYDYPDPNEMRRVIALDIDNKFISQKVTIDDIVEEFVSVKGTSFETSRRSIIANLQKKYGFDVTDGNIKSWKNKLEKGFVVRGNQLKTRVTGLEKNRVYFELGGKGTNRGELSIFVDSNTQKAYFERMSIAGASKEAIEDQVTFLKNSIDELKEIGNDKLFLRVSDFRNDDDLLELLKYGFTPANKSSLQLSIQLVDDKVYDLSKVVGDVKSLSKKARTELLKSMRSGNTANVVRIVSRELEGDELLRFWKNFDVDELVLDITDSKSVKNFDRYLKGISSGKFRPGTHQSALGLRMKRSDPARVPEGISITRSQVEGHRQSLTDIHKRELLAYKETSSDIHGYGFEEIQYMKRLQAGVDEKKLSIGPIKKYEIERTIEVIDDAFDRAELENGVDLFHYTVAKPGRPWTNVKVGDIVIDSGYVSTARMNTRSIAERFISGANQNNPPVLVVIHAKKGQRAIELSQIKFMGEFETLLPARTKFRVRSVENIAGKKSIYNKLDWSGSKFLKIEVDIIDEGVEEISEKVVGIRKAWSRVADKDVPMIESKLDMMNIFSDSPEEFLKKFNLDSVSINEGRENLVRVFSTKGKNSFIFEFDTERLIFHPEKFNVLHDEKNFIFEFSKLEELIDKYGVKQFKRLEFTDKGPAAQLFFDRFGLGVSIDSRNRKIVLDSFEDILSRGIGKYKFSEKASSSIRKLMKKDNLVFNEFFRIKGLSEVDRALLQEMLIGVRNYSAVNLENPLSMKLLKEGIDEIKRADKWNWDFADFKGYSQFATDIAEDAGRNRELWVETLIAKNRIEKQFDNFEDFARSLAPDLSVDDTVKFEWDAGEAVFTYKSKKMQSYKRVFTFKDGEVSHDLLRC